MENISSVFEVAAGSVIGRDHLRPLGWKNNQDGYAIRSSADSIVAVVTDGCGSETKSEVGPRSVPTWSQRQSIENFISSIWASDGISISIEMNTLQSVRSGASGLPYRTLC